MLSLLKKASVALGHLAIVLALVVSVAGAAHAQNTSANEGGDIAFGGPGSGPGQFLQLRDITLDAQGNLYTLDGVQMNPQTKAPEGNLRVQKFDNNGKFLAQFSIAAADLADKQDPQRIAVLRDGSVFITQPAAGLVQQYSPTGTKVRDITMPQAMAITTVGQGANERIAVVPSHHEVLEGKGWTWLGGDKIVILAPDGTTEKTIALQVEKPLEGVLDVTADRSGNFYLKAEPNAIYKFAPDGKPLKTFGGNATTRNPDGSEVLHTVAVDSKGNVYTYAWGNPGVVTRFDADGQTVTQREGQFKWADPWSVHSNYTILAMDPNDRLWVGVTHTEDPKGVNYNQYRAVPAVVRARADFFNSSNYGVKQTPVRMLGFRPDMKCDLRENVGYDLNAPVPMEYTVGAANRFVNAVSVNWHVYDALKNEVAKGTLNVPLQNGQAATAAFNWTPTRYGAYFVHCAMTSNNQAMGALGEHVGITPRFANVPVSPSALLVPDANGNTKDDWPEAERAMWSGMANQRIHPAKNEKDLVTTDAQIDQATKSGATFLVQLVDNVKDLTPDYVRMIVTRYKGRVKYYEICNEPNFTANVDDYYKAHAMAYGIIKEVDPQAQVMGPATVNLSTEWLTRLYQLGFKNVSDIVSMHDYEGHESISPEHWRWKYAQLRAIMAANGDANKPIWQTERAIAGVRADSFMGLVQAIRVTLHQDLLETIGIPSEHDNHYYLRQMGYSAVPSYLWSNNGPQPGALALRTRYALTLAMNRHYNGTLDFGETGNEYLMGVRYSGADGTTVALRNLGTRDTPVDFDVKGGSTLDVVDSWGNAQRVPVQNGKARLTLEQLPIYVRLTAGQDLTAPKINFGRDLAARAQWDYSSTYKGDFSLLNNGIIETYHSGDPNGDTNGAKIWQGDLPGDSRTNPQTLTMTFDHPQLINKVVVRGIRADNGFCALLDYDLEYSDGKTWKLIERIDRPMPPSEAAVTADANYAVWVDDTNLFVHQFQPVTASAMRLVVRDATYGLLPDNMAGARTNLPDKKLMLREIGIYAPSLPVSVTAAEQPQPGAAIPTAMTFAVKNTGTKAWQGNIHAFAPDGWTPVPATQNVNLEAGGSQNLTFQLTPPTEKPAGTSFVDVELRDDKGALSGTAFSPLSVPAPLEIAAQPAAPVAGGAQPLAAAIKNLTSAPLSGTASVQLSGARKIAPVEIPFGPIDPGQSANVQWQVPGVDAAAERWHADYRVTANGIAVTAGQDLARQRWQIVGPFPREFDTQFGPEKKIDFAQVFTDQMGRENKWTPVTANADGLVNLGDLLKPNNDVSAYAVAIVNSPQAQQALFSVGTDDGGKGWLNGKLVYSDDGSHGAAPGQQKIPVQLKAGRNEVLLKVTQGNGGWGFFFDLLDPATGKPLNDIVYAAR